MARKPVHVILDSPDDGLHWAWLNLSTPNPRAHSVTCQALVCAYCSGVIDQVANDGVLVRSRAAAASGAGPDILR